MTNFGSINFAKEKDTDTGMHDTRERCMIIPDCGYGFSNTRPGVPGDSLLYVLDLTRLIKSLVCPKV